MATISEDPRFRLARALLSGRGDADGGPGAAIDIFAALLEESRGRHGDASLNAALCQYEYGNALFRSVVRRRPLEDDDDGNCNAGGDTADGKEEEEDKKPAAKEKSQREIMAAAALKRSSATPADSNSSCNKRAKMDPHASAKDASQSKDDGRLNSTNAKTSESDVNDIDDLDLAFEMMDTSWEILLSHATNSSPAKNGQHIQQEQQQEWALGQIPRVLVCIGDLYSFREEYANAVDMFLRALTYREEAWNRMKKNHAQNDGGKGTESLTVEHLRCQRHLVENYVLVAEALLDCPEGGDIVCMLGDDGEEDAGSAVTANKAKGRVLAKAKDRANFAQSHYEMAREGLEEIVCRYGEMSAANIELGTEKEDIGYLAMLVVGVGNSIQKKG